MWWYLTLADSTRPVLGLLETVNSMHPQDALFAFIVLGIVPGTNIQLNFYAIAIVLIGMITGMVAVYLVRQITAAHTHESRQSRSDQLELASI